MEKLGPFELFVSAFGISSVGGLAALLRSKKELTVRSILSATLYSGVTGLIIAFLSYNYFGVTNPYFLLGVCGLAGIGGSTVLDFVVTALQNGGLNIRISPGNDKDKEER